MKKPLPVVLPLVFTLILALGASTAMAATAANQSPFGLSVGDYSNQLVIQSDGGNNVVFGIEDNNGQTQATGQAILNGPTASSASINLFADANGIVRGHLAPGSYTTFYGLSHGESAGRTQLSGWLDVSPERAVLHFAPTEQSRVELIGGIIYLVI